MSGQHVDRYESLVEGAPDALMVIDAEGSIVLVNAGLERLFGYPRTELVGAHYRVLFPDVVPGDVDPLAHQLRRNLHLVGRRRDGIDLVVEVRTSVLSSSAGEEVTVSIRDIGNRGRMDDELRSALSLLSATLQSTTDGILIVSNDGRITECNERFAELWGIPADVIESHDDNRLLDLIGHQLADPEKFVANVRQLYADTEATSTDVLTLRDGRTLERYSQPQRVAGKVVGRVWSFRETTQRLRAESQARDALAELAVQAEALRSLGFRDPLTGLANRALFHDRLASALGTRAARGASSVSVLLVDVDDFKEINDVFGHQLGDDFLIELGRRLTQCLHADDTVARLGGDEFAVLLRDAGDANSTAERILAALSFPAHLHGVEVRGSVSLGMASAAVGEGSLHGSELLRRADIAMYEAKAAGKNRYLEFHPDMMTALVARTDLEAGLRRAVERNEIVVHFQPIVGLGNAGVCQLEALVRWQRPTGLLGPNDFIAAAERSGSIIGIGEEVLRQACVRASDWLDGSDLRSLAVNVSGIQLQEHDFAERFMAILAAGGVRPSQVVIEVTESVFLRSGSSVIDQLRALRGQGVRISIDDFGTGYSSLGRLHDLPVDGIKVDKSFIDRIVTGDENLPILNSMIDMAHNLGLHVTAEGIEAEAQAAKLIDLGCDALQGYLFSKPQPPGNLPQAERYSAGLIRELLDVMQ